MSDKLSVICSSFSDPSKSLRFIWDFFCSLESDDVCFTWSWIKIIFWCFDLVWSKFSKIDNVFCRRIFCWNLVDAIGTWSELIFGLKSIPGEIKSFRGSYAIMEFWYSFKLICAFWSADFYTCKRLMTSWSIGIDLIAISWILWWLFTFKAPNWSLILLHLFPKTTFSLEFTLILKFCRHTWHVNFVSVKDLLTHSWQIVSPQNNFRGSLRLLLTLFWFWSWNCWKHTGHFEEAPNKEINCFPF